MLYKFLLFAGVAALGLSIKSRYQTPQAPYSMAGPKIIDPSIGQNISSTRDVAPSEFNEKAMQQLILQSNEVMNDLFLCRQDLARYTGESAIPSMAGAVTIKDLRSSIERMQSDLAKCNNDLNHEKSEANYMAQLKEIYKNLDQENRNILAKINQCERSKISVEDCYHNPNTPGCSTRILGYSASSLAEDYKSFIADAERIKEDLSMQLRDCQSSPGQAVQRETASAQ